MTLRWLIVVLAAPVCLLAGEPDGTDGAKGKVTQESLALVKRDFPYQPPARAETEQKPVDDAVMMAPYVVDESRMLKQLNQKLEDVNEKLKAEKFTLSKGGLFLRNERVEVGLKRYRDPLNPNAQFDPKGRFDLFRLKW